MISSAGHSNPQLAEYKEILAVSRTIAIVGISDKPDRPSYEVANYLAEHYTVIPVNPNLKSWLGMRCFDSLEAIPADVEIDIVDIFRRSEDVPAIVEAAISRSQRMPPGHEIQCIWMQIGVENEQAAELARKAGLRVVMNQCTAALHRRLFRQ